MADYRKALLSYKPKTDLYSLCHNLVKSMKRGPWQGVATRPGQNKILKILENKGDHTTQELKAKLGIRDSSLSELLKKLERDGYITRKATGRGAKETMVSITNKGRISALECKLSEINRDEELFGCLDQHDRDELVRILNKLLASWEEQDELTREERREQTWKENAEARDEMLEILASLKQIEEQMS